MWKGILDGYLFGRLYRHLVGGREGHWMSSSAQDSSFRVKYHPSQISRHPIVEAWECLEHLQKAWKPDEFMGLSFLCIYSMAIATMFPLYFYIHCNINWDAEHWLFLPWHLFQILYKLEYNKAKPRGYTTIHDTPMLLHVRKVKDEVSDVSTGMALQPLSPWPLSNVI